MENKETEIKEWEHTWTEFAKLPSRKERGNPDNLVRSLAAGFISMGYDCQTAIKKARSMIEFWDWIQRR